MHVIQIELLSSYNMCVLIHLHVSVCKELYVKLPTTAAIFDTTINYKYKYKMVILYSCISCKSLFNLIQHIIESDNIMQCYTFTTYYYIIIYIE